MPVSADHPPRFDTDIVRPFWESLARGGFQLPACSVCGAWQWYPYDFVRCHGEARLEWRPAPRTGTVPGTEPLLDACLPDAKPIVIKPLDPPVPGEGVQTVKLYCATPEDASLPFMR